MASEPNIRVRFPPSPTGELHLGSARTALYNYLFARQQGGSLVFRIEDTDQARYVPGAMDRFITDLKWLGLSWDEGPDVGGKYGPYIQSERATKGHNIYADVAGELIVAGAAYRCFCSPQRLDKMRAEQTKHKQPTGYDRHCLTTMSAGERETRKHEPHVIRFHIPDGATQFTDVIRGHITVQNKTLDDFVLLKSDNFPTYHLANIVDDHLMQISHVIRGEEWLPSTPKHLLLYRALDWEAPTFAHLPLILATDKKKLSKRIHGEAVWVATYRKEGYLPEALVNYLAFLGWNPGGEREFFTLDELAKEFSLGHVHKAGAVFDPEKLKFFNTHYLRQYGDDELLAKLKDGGFLSDRLANEPVDAARRFISIHRDRAATLAEFSSLIDPILAIADYPAEQLVFKKSDTERTLQGLTQAHDELAGLDESDWQQREILQTVLEKVVADSSLANGDVFWPVRVALSGQEASAAPAELLWALGKDESLKRLAAARDKLVHD